MIARFWFEFVPSKEVYLVFLLWQWLYFSGVLSLYI